MRVIAGEYKGRILTTVHDNSVRPATDRVKGSIFNMLQNRLGLIGADVLDVFAGSGSLGFEALSRGAGRVVFVEMSNSVVQTITANARMLGCLDRCEIVQSEAMEFMTHCRDQFDLIFVDPPYVFEETPAIPSMVFEHGLLKKDGFLIIEHSRRTQFAPSPMFHLAIHKQYGNTCVSCFTYPREEKE